MRVTKEKGVKIPFAIKSFHFFDGLYKKGKKQRFINNRNIKAVFTKQDTTETDKT